MGTLIDRPHRARHARHRAGRGTARLAHGAAGDLHDPRRQLDGELLPRRLRRASEQAGAGASHQRRQCPHGRQANDAEVRPAAADPGICGEALEILRGVLEGEAPVSRAVLVPALEALARVAEEKRARGHQGATRGGAVLECAGGHDGDEDACVPLLERVIPWPRGTQHIGHRPAAAFGEHPCGGSPRGSADGAPGQGMLQLESNFRQVAAPRGAIEGTQDTRGGNGRVRTVGVLNFTRSLHRGLRQVSGTSHSPGEAP